MSGAKSLRELVDPTLVAGFDANLEFFFSTEALPARRADFDLIAAQMPTRDAPDVVQEEIYCPGFAGAPDVRAVLYRPKHGKSQRAGAILQIHGGGYVVGNTLLNEQLNRATVQREGCMILSVDYRLAPETIAPGAVHDCYAGLCWLRDRADDYLIDLARIAVWGESAGGGMAAALAIFARDQGGPDIAFQLLSQPMLDDRTCVRTDLPSFADQLPWSLSSNRYAWRAYLGVAPGSDDVPRYAVPARAETLASLPSTYIAIGALDLFILESLEYAQRLAVAGVPVEVHVYPGCYHGFDVVGSALGAEISLRCVKDGEAALHRALSAAQDDVRSEG